VTAHIREEVLSREALALGLDRDDTIVRRRLAQKMEFLTDDLTGASPPDEQALNQFFAARAARYAMPGRVSFRHVFFSQEKRREGGEAAAHSALAALESGAGEEAFGDAFLHGFEFAERDEDEIAALFGREFAGQISAQATGAWQGPIASSYGLHLVRIEARTEATPVTLPDVREAVVRDFNDERRRTANREVFDRLRQRYRVTVDESALERAAQAAGETVQR
jgi:parvulin-like peptidyl-prolyl isomerase